MTSGTDEGGEQLSHDRTRRSPWRTCWRNIYIYIYRTKNNHETHSRNNGRLIDRSRGGLIGLQHKNKMDSNKPKTRHAMDDSSEIDWLVDSTQKTTLHFRYPYWLAFFYLLLLRRFSNADQSTIILPVHTALLLCAVAVLPCCCNTVICIVHRTKHSAVLYCCVSCYYYTYVLQRFSNAIHVDRGGWGGDWGCGFCLWHGGGSKWIHN